MKACPPGWRLPTKEEWWALRKAYGGAVAAFPHLLEGGDSGFEARLGGYRYGSENFTRRGEFGCFWSSTTVNKGKRVLGFDFHKPHKKIKQIERSKSVGRSVRCILDQ